MKENESTGYGRRWYDQIGAMTQAIHISRELPPEIQVLIARSLNEAIEHHRKSRRTDKNAISVGHARVLGLYRANYGKRWYDPSPHTGRAFNFMGTVPDLYLEELANRIVHIGSYFKTQQVALPGQYDRYSVTNTVQDLLRDGQLRIEQRDSGIRVVQDYPTSFPIRRRV